MRITIEIDDLLFAEVAHLAAAQHTALREMVESGLRREIERRRVTRRRIELKDGSVGGDGPTEEWLRATWDEKVKIIYGDRT